MLWGSEKSLVMTRARLLRVEVGLPPAYFELPSCLQLDGIIMVCFLCSSVMGKPGREGHK